MNLQDTAILLDTCVLLKPRMSDVIMDIRAEQLMAVHWSESIDSEFLRNMTRVYGVSDDVAARRLAAMKRRCPEWEVLASQKVFDQLPAEVDDKDRHVAAAALVIRQSADEETDAYDVILVTDNVKDFAPKQMGSLGVRVMTSGKFLDEAYLAEPDAVERAVRQAVRDLKAPPYSLEELLFALREQRATTMVKALAAKLGVSPKAKARISSKR